MDDLTASNTPLPGDTTNLPGPAWRCGSTFTSLFPFDPSVTTVQCNRVDLHKGDHQSVRHSTKPDGTLHASVAEWRQGGGGSVIRAYDLVDGKRCITCDILLGEWVWSVEPLHQDGLGHSLTCFNCDFWLKKIAEQETTHRYMIINGRCYCWGHQDGSGGRPFNIESLDQSEEHYEAYQKRRGLWSQGEVPAHFRDQLPDTHRFVHTDLDRAKENVFNALGRKGNPLH